MIITSSPRYNQRKPEHVEGNVKIELVDPITKKVKERIMGKNHAFTDVLFDMAYGYGYGSASSTGLVYPWTDKTKAISEAWLCMNDDNTAVDPTLPYLRGNIIGYGQPTQAGSGDLMGAYVAAAEKLAEGSDSSKISWFFQYEFTTSQANGTIKNVGLSTQYNGRAKKSLQYGKPVMASGPSRMITGDGRYRYSIGSGTGIIRKYDMHTGAYVDIDISATVGTTSGDTKSVGYAPLTGKYYVFRYSSTSGNRRMFVYSDNTFSTLETTFTPSNVAINVNNYPFYVYGDNMYYLTSDNNVIYVADFIANTAYVSRTINFTPLSVFPTLVIGPYYSSFANTDGIWMGINYESSATNQYLGILYDPIADKTKFYHYVPSGSYGPAYSGFLFPNKDVKLWGFYAESSYDYQLLYGGCAYTSHVLETPVTKTSANGLIATYELDVYW